MTDDACNSLGGGVAERRRHWIGERRRSLENDVLMLPMRHKGLHPFSGLTLTGHFNYLGFLKGNASKVNALQNF